MASQSAARDLLRALYRSAAASRSGEKFFQINLKSLPEVPQAYDRRIPLSQLQATYISPINAHSGQRNQLISQPGGFT